MKIVIIRHAEPDYPNNTLTTKGFREAKYLGEYYKDAQIDALYSSPLPRAKLTAEALANNKIKVQSLDWLKEFWHEVMIDDKLRHNWDFLPRLIDKYPILMEHEFLDANFSQEDLRGMYNEVIKNFDILLAAHGYVREASHYKVTKPNKDVIVIVCHLGMMSILMSRLSGIPYTQIAQYFFVAPSGVTTYVSEEREEGIAQFRCREFGNLDHLRRKDEPYSKFGSFAETFESEDEMH